MTWHSIQTEADIAALMDSFNHFHDSLIHELHCWSDYWAPQEEDAGLDWITEQLSYVRILFQRRGPDPVALELLFSGVVHFTWVPVPPRHVPDIYQAVMTITDGLVYWTNQ